MTVRRATAAWGIGGALAFATIIAIGGPAKPLLGPSDSDTITAASCSIAHVEAAIAEATDGDTVLIPAGTCDWDDTVTVTKALTIRGQSDCTLDGNDRATSCATVLRDTFSSGQYFFSVQLVSGQTTRIAHLEFRDHTGDATYYLNMDGLNDSRRMRVDHNFFNCNGDVENAPGNDSAGVFLAETVLGTFDHNTVHGCIAGFLGYVKGSLWDTGVDNNGDYSQAEGDNFGTDQFWFIESNTLALQSAIYHLGVLDGQAGARYVFRYNDVTQGSIEGHGLEAERERSTRACEIYHNTFTGINTQAIMTYMRGAVCLVYDNAVYGYTATPSLALLNNRSNTALASPFGGMDGRNPWDVNDAGNPFETGTCDSVGSLTCTDTGRSFTDYAGYTIRATKGNSCGGGGTASLARSGSTVTVTCNSHGYSNGNIVGVWGANETAYNGVWTIAGVATNTFTYTINYTPDSPATGTIRVRLGNYFSEVASNTTTQFTFKDSLYSGNYSLIFLTGDTFEINKVTHAMDQVGRVMGSSALADTKITLPEGWNDQTTSPWYEWDNLKCPSSPPAVGCASGADVDFVSHAGVVVLETHAISDTEKPGYTAYTYPHPLTGS